MITQGYFKNLVEQGLIASVRVVPVPFEQAWCIDAVVRTPLSAGSTTDTVATREESDNSGRLRKFETIDAASSFLRSVGVKTFTVDTDDAVSLANVGQYPSQVIETTMQLWSEDGEDSRVAAVG